MLSIISVGSDLQGCSHQCRLCSVIREIGMWMTWIFFICQIFFNCCCCSGAESWAWSLGLAQPCAMLCKILLEEGYFPLPLTWQRQTFGVELRGYRAVSQTFVTAYLAVRLAELLFSLLWTSPIKKKPSRVREHVWRCGLRQRFACGWWTTTPMGREQLCSAHSFLRPAAEFTVIAPVA